MSSPNNSLSMYSLPLAYRNAGFCWNIAIFAVILNVVAISGILMNGAVIWVTIKTRSLQGTVNFHLALGSLVEMMHQSGHMLFLYVSLTGQNFIQYWLAVHICSLSLFGMGSVALCITFTAMDRLLYVLFPFFTRILKPAIYLTIVTIVVILFCFLNLGANYMTAEQMPNFQITGSIQDLMQGFGGNWYNTISFVLNMVTLAIYVAMAAAIKFKKGTTSTIAGRIFKSITVLVCVNLSGFITCRAYRLFVYPLLNDQMLKWYIAHTFSVILNISTASTGPILYITSMEYRTAFQKHFSTVYKFLRISDGSQQSSNGKMAIAMVSRSRVIALQPNPCQIKYSN